MSLNGNAKIVRGRPGPEKALEINCDLTWGAKDAFLLGMEGRLSYAGQDRQHVLCETVFPGKIWFHNNHSMDVRDLAVLQNSRDFKVELVAPITSEGIKLIENRRGDSDINLQLEVRYRWQDVVAVPTDKTQHPQGKMLIGGPVQWNKAPIHLPAVPRSDRLKHLKELQWSETELFEIESLPLIEEENLNVALKLLNEARDALRLQDHKGVLVKCRGALESAAKYHSEGDTRKGYELLLDKAFPEHKAKPEVFDKVITGLTECFHALGRHEQYPALHVTRGEAEFALTTTLGLFSLLSRRLANKETV